MMFHSSMYFAHNQSFIHQIVTNVIVCQEIAMTQKDSHPCPWKAELWWRKPRVANLERLFSLGCLTASFVTFLRHFFRTLTSSTQLSNFQVLCQVVVVFSMPDFVSWSFNEPSKKKKKERKKKTINVHNCLAKLSKV